MHLEKLLPAGFTWTFQNDRLLIWLTVDCDTAWRPILAFAWLASTARVRLLTSVGTERPYRPAADTAVHGKRNAETEERKRGLTRLLAIRMWSQLQADGKTLRLSTRFWPISRVEFGILSALSLIMVIMLASAWIV